MTAKEKRGKREGDRVTAKVKRMGKREMDKEEMIDGEKSKERAGDRRRERAEGESKKKM